MLRSAIRDNMLPGLYYGGLCSAATSYNIRRHTFPAGIHDASRVVRKNSLRRILAKRNIVTLLSHNERTLNSPP